MVEEAQLHAEAALAAQETRHETTLENLQVGTLSMSQQTLVTGIAKRVLMLV